MAILRTDETEDEVDFLPPIPDRRRYEFERGVSGTGDRESRFAWVRDMLLVYDPLDEAVESRGLAGYVALDAISGR